MSILTAPTAHETITLYYREGASDKVYQASIEPSGDGFVVNFAFGRRGSTLSAGTKTSAPVGYEIAKRIYDKLLREKNAKGYTPGDTGTPYKHTANEGRVSPYLPQLLAPIEESEAPAYLRNDQWCMQEKFDGRRMLISKSGATIHGINRKGLVVPLPETVYGEIQTLRGDLVLDGECLGDSYVVFDVLGLDGEDFRPKPMSARIIRLVSLLDLHLKYIRAVDSKSREEDKEAMLIMLRSTGKEGVVFKNMDAPYIAGRPASGASQVKLKFYATASFVVGAVNAQRSILLHLFNAAGETVRAGNVTVPPNQPIPEAGAIIEVRYLYAYRQSGSVYQPTLLGRRDDLVPSDCVTSQLKFRADNRNDEES
jgi:bifunctional non-homologous end joining protein LigD